MSDIIESCALGHHNSYIEVSLNGRSPKVNMPIELLVMKKFLYE